MGHAHDPLSGCLKGHRKKKFPGFAVTLPP
jgi:hypothetical protein